MPVIINMTLYQMPAEFTVQGECPFKVDAAAGAETTEVGAPLCLRYNINSKGRVSKDVTVRQTPFNATLAPGFKPCHTGPPAITRVLPALRQTVPIS